MSNKPVVHKGVHEQCLNTVGCVRTTELYRGCLTCGFFKPEAERRKTLPVMYCEDGLYRKFLGDPHEQAGDR